MVDFRQMKGWVYILENPKANHVKIGMTINDVTDRLRDANDKWLRIKVTCQVCGSLRIAIKDRLVPKHTYNGSDCPGGNSLSLENDTSLAKSHLEDLKNNYVNQTGSDKGSTTRIINNLERRIELHCNNELPVGRWRQAVKYNTDCAEHVELLSHQVLADRLDKSAPFGEVFNCSVDEAAEVVESVLEKLDLRKSAKKAVESYDISPNYGQCSICGKNVTESGACPSCIERLFN